MNLGALELGALPLRTLALREMTLKAMILTALTLGYDIESVDSRNLTTEGYDTERALIPILTIQDDP